MKELKEFLIENKISDYRSALDEYKETGKQIVVNREQLEKIINSCPDNADLNFLDVSNINDMSNLFEYSTFNGDISKWNVSNVENMCSMFERSKFNGDISKWNVRNVTNMDYMFNKSSFNQDISNWNASNVITGPYFYSRSRGFGNLDDDYLPDFSNSKDFEDEFGKIDWE